MLTLYTRKRQNKRVLRVCHYVIKNILLFKSDQ
jgi:hypothetical protein